MAQGDLNVANQSGAAFRADLNNQLLALGTMQSGAAEPAPTYAYQLWADTTNGLLKQRNGANNAWITIGTLDAANWGLLTTATASSSYLALAGGTVTGNLAIGSGAPVDTDGWSRCLDLRGGPGSVIYLRGTDNSTFAALGYWTSGNYVNLYNSNGPVYIDSQSGTRFTVGNGLFSFNNTISLGSSFSGTAGANPKIRLYDGGSASTYYGIGISANQQDYIVPSGGRHVFYVDGRERLRVRNFGDFNTSSPPGSEVGFGYAAILKGDLYIEPTYTARWTTLGLELQSGNIATAISTWSDNTWRSGNNYDLFYGDWWGASNGGSASAHYFQVAANADGTNNVRAFSIIGDSARAFRAFGPGYGAIPAYFCRAWVNFNGTSIGVRASGNVSSVTKNTTGDYTLNFTTALPDANYTIVSTTNSWTTTDPGGGAGLNLMTSGFSSGSPTTYTTTQVRLLSGGNTRIDCLYGFVGIFR